MNRRLLFVLLIGIFSESLMAFQSTCPIKVNALLENAKAHRDENRWAQALFLYEKALLKLPNNGGYDCKAIVHSNIGTTNMMVGDFLAEVDTTGFVKLLDGRIGVEGSFYVKGLQSYTLSVQNARRAGNLSRLAYSTYGMALANGKLNMFDDSQSLFLQADSIFLNYLNGILISQSRDSLEINRTMFLNASGASYYDEGKVSSDTSLIEKSVQVLLSGIDLLDTDDFSRLLSFYNNLGRSLLWLGKYDHAHHYYLLAAQYASTLDNEIAQGRAWYGLAHTYHYLGEQDSSFKYFIRYDESHDNYFREKQIRDLALYNRLFQIERVEAHNERLKTQVFLIVILLFLLISTLFYLHKLGVSQKKIADQKIGDLLQQQEIRSLQGVLAGQEEERKRIAGDLHDKLGAILGMVKLHFSAVEEKIDVLRDDNKQQYEKANDLLDQASEEVRNISHNLVSGVLTKFGLVPALNDLKDKIESTGKLKVQLLINEMGERLSGEKELQLYRIVQELVSNILKHAKAASATIQLNRQNSTLNLIVEDDGIGFDTDRANRKTGMGMQNLQARVDQLNGTLHYDSGKGSGTTVSIDIPIEE